MNAQLNGRLVAILMAVAMLLATGLAVGGELGIGSSQAPGAEPRFKVGDTLTIAADRANLMVGSVVVAALSRGARIVVVEVRDSWIGTYVSVNGQQKAGWIGAIDFIPTGLAADSEARVSTAFLPIVSESVPAVAGSGVNPTPPVPRIDHSHDYASGYYQEQGVYYNEHGVEPNIHVWEPWRY